MVNSFSYADDMVVVASSAGALNELLGRCEKVVVEYYIENSTYKTVCLTLMRQPLGALACPHIYLSGSTIIYVARLNYFSRLITEVFTDKSTLQRKYLCQKLCYFAERYIKCWSFELSVSHSILRTFGSVLELRIFNTLRWKTTLGLGC